MDQDATALLTQLKDEQTRTSDRMHRDARRQHTLKQASLMLGTGIHPDEVRTWLGQKYITLQVRIKTVASVLVAVLTLATVAQAAPLASVSEPSPARAYDQRWEWTVRSCAASVVKITERPLIYQVGFAGSVPRYTTNRQEHLLQLCLELRGMLGLEGGANLNLPAEVSGNPALNTAGPSSPLSELDVFRENLPGTGEATQSDLGTRGNVGGPDQYQGTNQSLSDRLRP